MEFFQPILNWASDASNSNAVRTFVALLAIPGALWGAYLLYLKLTRRGIDSQLAAIREGMQLGIDSAWDQIKDSNDPKDFTQFIDKYCDHFLATQAKKQLSALDRKAWSLADSLGTISALESYIKAWPGGEHVSRAREAIDHAQHRRQQDAATVKSLVANAEEQRRTTGNMSIKGLWRAMEPKPKKPPTRNI
jgi:hypothetical protein